MIESSHLEQSLKIYDTPTLNNLIRQHMHATVKCLGVNGSKKLQLANLRSELWA